MMSGMELRQERRKITPNSWTNTFKKSTTYLMAGCRERNCIEHRWVQWERRKSFTGVGANIKKREKGGG